MKKMKKCISTVVGISSVKPPIVSIDLDSEDSVSIGILESPPIQQRGNIFEKDIEINLDIVNNVAK